MSFEKAIEELKGLGYGFKDDAGDYCFELVNEFQEFVRVSVRLEDYDDYVINSEWRDSPFEGWMSHGLSGKELKLFSVIGEYLVKKAKGEMPDKFEVGDAVYIKADVVRVDHYPRPEDVAEAKREGTYCEEEFEPWTKYTCLTIDMLPIEATEDALALYSRKEI